MRVSVESLLKQFIALTKKLQVPHDMESLLPLIVNTSGTVLNSERASLRMIDPSGKVLLALCRYGYPLHENAATPFALGEGLMGWVVLNARPLRVADAERDPRFVKKEGMKSGMGSFLGVPIISGASTLGVISAVHHEKGYFTELHEECLTLIAGICAPQLEIVRLTRLATVDPLTGALNRRGLERIYPADPCSLSACSQCAIMADIDHFKRVNDAYGHSVGDQVLKQVANILGMVVRENDAVIRYGGEEFLILLNGAKKQAAFAVAERARSQMEQAVFHVGEEHIQATISLGVAERREGELRDQLIKRADEALYAAKQKGRNRVEGAVEEA